MAHPIQDDEEPPESAEPWLGGITLRGRHFGGAELLQIRAIVQALPQAHRFELSKRVCEALDWRQPNGRLKDRARRDVLARLHALGLLRPPRQDVRR